jgi:hypothetical protein
LDQQKIDTFGLDVLVGGYEILDQEF